MVINAGALSNATGVSSSGTINFSGLTGSKVVFTDSSKNLTSTGTVGVNQGGTGVGTFGGNNTLLYTSSADNIGSIANGAAGQYLKANGSGAPAFATIQSGDITNSDFLVKVPGITADNTVTPTANGVVSMVLKGTTGTGTPDILDIANSSGSTQSYFDSLGALHTSQPITAPTTTNTINGLVINSGALSNITGYTQSSGNFTVNGSGTVSLGTGTGNVGIGNTTGTLNISSTGLNVSTTGALTGVPSLDTINTSATSLGFVGTGAITSGNGTDLSLTSGTTGAVSVDSGTTGNVNIGTGNNSKTVNIATGNAGNTVNIATDNNTANTLNLGSSPDTINLTGTTSILGVANINT